jgi:nucleoside-diphosphate-sugar epimerase
VIVVTGASGVIGRALMARLRLEGMESVAVRRDAFDLASGTSLQEFVGQRPSAIIHLAAAVPHSTRYPDTESSAAMTRAIDRTVHEAAVGWGCRVVYASTCSLYDKHTPAVKFENTAVVVRPDSPYMQAKFEGERLFCTLPSYSILRVPAPIGPGLPDTVVAKRFLNQAIAGQTIRVWGTGKREQNYVDVADIADIFLRAAASTAIGIFNIAAHAPTTMLELAAAIAKFVDQGSFELAGIPDPLEQEYTRYSNARALEMLEWSPQVPLEDSLRAMYETHHDIG